MISSGIRTINPLIGVPLPIPVLTAAPAAEIPALAGRAMEVQEREIGYIDLWQALAPTRVVSFEIAGVDIDLRIFGHVCKDAINDLKTQGQLEHPSEWIRKAHELKNAGLLIFAEELMDIALDFFPENPELWHESFSLKIAARDVTEACYVFRLACKQGISYLPLLQDYIFLLRNMGETGIVRETFKEIFSPASHISHPNDVIEYAMNNMADIMAEAGEKLKQREIAEAAVARFPDNIYARTILASIMLENFEFEETISLLEEGLQRNPKDIVMAVMLVSILSFKLNTKERCVAILFFTLRAADYSRDTFDKLKTSLEMRRIDHEELAYLLLNPNLSDENLIRCLSNIVDRFILDPKRKIHPTQAMAVIDEAASLSEAGELNLRDRPTFGLLDKALSRLTDKNHLQETKELLATHSQEQLLRCEKFIKSLHGRLKEKILLFFVGMLAGIRESAKVKNF